MSVFCSHDWRNVFCIVPDAIAKAHNRPTDRRTQQTTWLCSVLNIYHFVEVIQPYPAFLLSAVFCGGQNFSHTPHGKGTWDREEENTKKQYHVCLSLAMWSRMQFSFTTLTCSRSALTHTQWRPEQGKNILTNKNKNANWTEDLFRICDTHFYP